MTEQIRILMAIRRSRHRAAFSTLISSFTVSAWAGTYQLVTGSGKGRLRGIQAELGASGRSRAAILWG
jgi:hypothetical protein